MGGSGARAGYEYRAGQRVCILFQSSLATASNPFLLDREQHLFSQQPKMAAKFSLLVLLTFRVCRKMKLVWRIVLAAHILLGYGHVQREGKKGVLIDVGASM
ncbi:hypothetical protein DFH27DRAFT_608079 [Peziza echinospora]|nr:hypothetical protein DFH27DRAFT_608079 [Peziza echinospora]